MQQSPAVSIKKSNKMIEFRTRLPDNIATRSKSLLTFPATKKSFANLTLNNKIASFLYLMLSLSQITYATFGHFWQQIWLLPPKPIAQNPKTQLQKASHVCIAVPNKVVQIETLELKTHCCVKSFADIKPMCIGEHSIHIWFVACSLYQSQPCIQLIYDTCNF